MKNLLFLLVTILIVVNNAFSQGVAINTSGADCDSSAILDVSSTSGGLLLPRMTTTERDLIVSPAQSLIIYNTTTKCLEVFENGFWQEIYCSCTPPQTAPSAGTHVGFQQLIIWNWDSVAGAEGYQWNTTNTYPGTGVNVVSGTSFTQTGLSCNTVYNLYVWAYNSFCYTQPVMLTQTTEACFTCGVDILTDIRDGQTYTTVLIGNQCWMAENLNYGTYVPWHNGQQLPGEKYCNSLNNTNDSTCAMGGLYTWGNVMNGSASCNGTGALQVSCDTFVQGICPPGWHIPSESEMTRMERSVSGSSPDSLAFPYSLNSSGSYGYAGEATAMKSTSFWTSGGNGTNTSGFNVLPAGYAHTNGGFYEAGARAYIWTSTNSKIRRWSDYSSQIYRSYWNYTGSVRCVKDYNY